MVYTLKLVQDGLEAVETLIEGDMNEERVLLDRGKHFRFPVEVGLQPTSVIADMALVTALVVMVFWLFRTEHEQDQRRCFKIGTKDCCFAYPGTNSRIALCIHYIERTVSLAQSGA